MIILCYITVWHKRTVSSFMAFTLPNGFCIATTVSTVLLYGVVYRIPRDLKTTESEQSSAHG